MAVAAHTTRIEGPSLDEIRRKAAEIRRGWSGKEHNRRRLHAHTAQQRLLGLALASAA